MTQLKRYAGGLGIQGAIVLSLVLLFAFTASAQLPTGTILGTVKDSTGGTVAGAAVTATNADTGATRSGTTGEDGAYRFPALAVGNWIVRVSKEGFQTTERKGITLEVTQEAAIDFTLQLGATGQTVTVTEEAPMVNTTSSSVGGLVSEEKVADLPLNGRNWTDLTLMQTGITQSDVFTTSATTSSGVVALNMTGTMYSSNGAPIRSNMFLLDGAIQNGAISLNNSSIIGTSLGVDGIKEYKVVSNVPSADYGLTMGSQSTIVTKSGTNAFHGDAFEYIRNSALDARNFFDGIGPNGTSVAYPGKRLPPFVRNNFGGAVGGPLRKDKTFFFATYEGLRQSWGQTITTKTLPSACYNPANKQPWSVAGGTYSDAHTPGLTLLPGQMPSACTSFTPLTVASTAINLDQFDNPTAGTPRNTGVVAKFLAAGLFPAPNVTGQTFNYTFPFKQPQSEDYTQGRLDHTFSASDSFFGRYTRDNADMTGNRAYPQWVELFHSAYQFITLSETHVISPTLLNTARFSYSRTVSQTTSNTPGLVLGSGATHPEVQLAPGMDMGSVSPGGGVSGFGPNAAPGLYLQNLASWSDDVFWSKGRHAFKFGVLFNQNMTIENVVFREKAEVLFANLTNFLNGVTSGGNFTGGLVDPNNSHAFATNQNRFFRYATIGGYVQDDVRATNRLTLNLGLRYEIATIPREMTDKNFTVMNVRTATGGYPNYGAVQGRMFAHNPSLHAFSPRIGFAYDPTGKGTTSIRGGYGMLYDIGGYGTYIFQFACCMMPYSDFNIYNNSSSSANPFPLTLPLLPTDPSACLYNPLPNGTLPPPCNPTFQLQPPSPRVVDVNIKQTAMQQWNLSIDHQLPWNSSVTLSYVGSRGTHINTVTEGNPTNPVGYFANGLPYFCSGTSGGAPTPANPCPTTVRAQGTAGSNLTRVNRNFGAVTYNTADRDTKYNSLQAALTKRVTKGLSFQGSYTWSHMDDNGQAQIPTESAVSVQTQLPQATRTDWGPSAYDVRQNFRFNATYHMPDVVSSTGVLSKFANGWWFGGIVSMQTGYPFTVQVAPGSTNALRSLTANLQQIDRPDLASTYDPAKVILHNPNKWFDPTMFSVPMVGTYGNVGRDTLRQDHLRNVDLSFNKDTKARFLGEQGSVQFRAEVFNIANKANFGGPVTTAWNVPSATDPATGLPCNIASNPGGGQIGTAGQPCLAAFPTAGQVVNTMNRSRQIQFSLKVQF